MRNTFGALGGAVGEMAVGAAVFVGAAATGAGVAVAGFAASVAGGDVGWAGFAVGCGAGVGELHAASIIRPAAASNINFPFMFLSPVKFFCPQRRGRVY